MLRRRPIAFFAPMRRRYGDVFRVSFPGFSRLVYVTDPALVKELFTGDPAQLHAGEANASVLEPAVGPNSVLTLDEGEHMRQRKLLLPPFHGKSIERYGEVMREVAARNIDGWPLGEPFPLRPQTTAITLEVILRTVFGVNSPVRLREAGTAIEQFAGRSQAVLLIPFLRRDLGRFSPWSRFLRARAKLDAFVYEEITLRRDDPDAESRDDVLSLLLGARHDDGSPMSDAELRDELITVIGAGHETTATALAWAIERLLRTPRVLERLRESIAAGEDDYLDATIKETLRTRPVIADVARKLTAPLEIGGYTIPEGWFVLAGIAAMHYREDLYPRARGVPAGALPRRGRARHLRLDPVRRRGPPLRRRRLRAVRDEDRPPRDPRADRASCRDAGGRAPDGPQRDPGAVAEHQGGARAPLGALAGRDRRRPRRRRRLSSSGF